MGLIVAENLIVKYKDCGVIISEELLTQQNAWDSLGKIKNLHLEKLYIENIMSNLKSDNDILMIYDSLLTMIEFELQDAWGFKRNKDYHTYWYRPHCNCPKLDNLDAYPYGYYVYSLNCPLHGY